MQMISIPLHSTTNSYHLGNNDEVVDAKGVVQQVTNYYPFGAPYADATASKGADVQPYKYNGKELDLMHGLNTYDYGARQYNPVTARWDRIDPLCEKYYNVSPYVYAYNNPVKNIDPNGEEPIEAITAAATTFVVEVGVDFFSNYLTNGFNSEEAVKNINFKEATCDALCAGASSLIFSGTGVSSVMAKLCKTEIAGVNIGKLVSATAENMISSVSSKIMQGKSLSEINFGTEFLEAAAGSLLSAKLSNKTETAAGAYQESASKTKTAQNKLDRNIKADKNENRIRSDRNRLSISKQTETSNRNRYINSKSKETIVSNTPAKAYDIYKKDDKK